MVAKARFICICGGARVSSGGVPEQTSLRLTTKKPSKTHQSVKLLGETSPRKSNAIRKRSTMSVSILSIMQPALGLAHNSAKAGAADLRMLAQVEKWMAMIREISREQQSQPAFQR
jgi:hypothetical protein